jgi:O-antigen ligase
LLAEIKKEYAEHKGIFIVSLIFIAINAILMAFEIFWFVGLPFVLIFAYIAIKALDRFILFIVFLTPLSVPLEYYYPDLGFNLQLITEPLLILVLLIFFYRIILERQFDRQILTHPISWLIYAQLFWMLMTSITSSMPLVSFKFLVSRIWFLVAFYFLVAAMFRKRKMIRWYLWIYLPSMLIVVATAIIYLSQFGLFSHAMAYKAAHPFFRDHTSYGAIIAMLIPVIAALGSFKKYPVPIRLLAWIIFSIFCFALLLSYTRAAWISVVIIAGIFVVVKLRISWKLIGLGVFLVASVFYLYRTDIFLKLEQNQQDSSKDIAKHIKSISNIRTDASNMERINRWNSAFRMFHERPIVGWGPGTYMFQYAPFQASREKTIISTNRGDWGNAHSEYIGPLAESGIPGLLIMVVLVIASIFLGFKVYYAAEPYSQERIFSLAVTLGLITYYIHGILNNFLDTDKASALVWGYTAMLVAMDIKNSESRAIKTQESNHS